MKNIKGLASGLFWLSLVALVLAAAVSFFQVDLWLAGTQWILVAITLVVYAIYLNCQEVHGKD
ncbi:MAG: hypothetical protein U9M90_00695 [Patescibacteria group bacterium]|nr:hypothetical protein [Patescibacteria group bacterium]